MRRWSILAASVVLVAALHAQEPAILPAHELALTRAENGEALLRRVNVMLTQDRSTEAIRILVDLLEDGDPNGLVENELRIVTLQRAVLDMLRALPSEDLKVYQSIVNEPARLALETHTRTGEVAPLQRIVTRYPLSKAYGQALLRLASVRLNEGRFCVAMECLERYRDEVSADLPERFRLMLALARVRCGRRDVASLLEGLPAEVPGLKTLRDELADTTATKDIALGDTFIVTWKRRYGSELPPIATSHQATNPDDPVFDFKKHGRVCVDSLMARNGRLYQRLGLDTTVIAPETGEVIAAFQQDEATQTLRRLVAQPNQLPLPMSAVPTVAGIVSLEDWIGAGMSTHADVVFGVEQSLRLSVESGKGSKIVKRHSDSGDVLWQIGKDLEALQKNQILLPMIAPITVDAELDDWKYQRSIRLTLRGDRTRNTIDGSGRIACSEEGIHVLVRAVDDTPNEAGTKPGRDDHVTIAVFDQSPHQDSFTIGISWSGDDVRVKKSNLRRRTLPVDCKVAVSVLPEEYIVELTVPWTVFGSEEPPFDRPLKIKPSLHEGNRFCFLSYSGHDWLYTQLRIEQAAAVDEPWKVTGANFLREPFPIGTQLLLPYRKGKRFSLSAVSARSGALRWDLNLGPEEPRAIPPRTAIRQHGTATYILNGYGILAAVAPGQGTVQWMLGYRKADLGKPSGGWNRSEDHWSAEAEIAALPGWQRNQLLSFGETIVAFPCDINYAIAVDTSGEMRYTLPREQFSYVLGQHENLAYVAGQHAVGGFDIPTGKWRWRSELRHSHGKGILVDDKIFMPDGKQVVVLNRLDGTELRRIQVNGYFEHPLLNLAAVDGALFVYGAGKVARLAVPEQVDLSKLTARNRAQVQRTQGDDKAALNTLLTVQKADASVADEILELIRETAADKAVARRLLQNDSLARPRLQLKAIDILTKAREFDPACAHAFDLLLRPDQELIDVNRADHLQHSVLAAAASRLKLLNANAPDVFKKAWQKARSQAGDDRDKLAALLSVTVDAADRQSLIEALTPHLSEAPGLRSLLTGQKLETPLVDPDLLHKVQSFEYAGALRVTGSRIRLQEGRYVLSNRGQTITCYDFPSTTPKWSFSMNKEIEYLASRECLPFVLAYGRHGRLLCLDQQTGHVYLDLDLPTLLQTPAKPAFWPAINWARCENGKVQVRLELLQAHACLVLDPLTRQVTASRLFTGGRFDFTDTPDGPAAIRHAGDAVELIHFDSQTLRSIDTQHWAAPNRVVQSAGPNLLIDVNGKQIRAWQCSPHKLLWTRDGAVRKAPPLCISTDRIVLHGDGELVLINRQNGESGTVDSSPKTEWHKGANGDYILGLLYADRKTTYTLVDLAKRETTHTWSVPNQQRLRGTFAIDGGDKILFNISSGLRDTTSLTTFSFFSRSQEQIVTQKVEGRKMVRALDLQLLPNGFIAVRPHVSYAIFKPVFQD